MEIREEAKARYDVVIDEVVKAVNAGPEARVVQAEHFGFFVNRLVRKFMHTVDFDVPAFNSILFTEPKKRLLINATDKLSVYLQGGEATEMSGDLIYIIERVYHGVTEGKENNMRPLYRGIMEAIKDSLKDAKFDASPDQKRRLMGVRRYWVTVGVLAEILSL
jgi:hypothetical protein